MVKISKEEKKESQSHSFLSNFSKGKIKLLEDDNGNNYIFISSKNVLIRVKDNSDIDELILNLQLNKNGDELPEISTKLGTEIKVDFYSEDKKEKYDLLFKERDEDFSEKVSNAYGGYVRFPLRTFLNNFDFSTNNQITKETATEYLQLAMEQTKKRQQKMHRPVSEYSIPEGDVQEEIISEFESLMKQLHDTTSNFQICELKDLEYNDRSHLSMEEASNELMGFYIRPGLETGSILLDISELPAEIQIILMRNFYEKEIDLSQSEISAIRDYQSLEYGAFKALMDGRKEKYIDSYLNDLIEGKIKRLTIDITVKDIYTLMDLFEKLPKRKVDFLISRLGSEEPNEDGIIEYDSFTSFGTNLGTNTMENKNAKLFKTILKKDDPAIPIIIIMERMDRDVYKECEMLLPPAKYKSIQMDGYLKMERQDLSTKDILSNITSQLSLIEEKLQAKIQREDIPNDKIGELLEMIENAKEFIKSKNLESRDATKTISETREDVADTPVLTMKGLSSMAQEEAVIMENEHATEVIDQLEKGENNKLIDDVKKDI